MNKLVACILRLRFTITMLLFLILVAVLTNTVFQEISQKWLDHLGFASNDLWFWRLERLFTSVFVTSGNLVFWEAIILVALFVGLAEWKTGWKRTAATFWSIHLFSLILFSAIMALLAHQFRLIGFEASEIARDVGPSAGYFACLGLVSASLKKPYRWIITAAILLFLIISLFLPAAASQDVSLKFSADMVHLIAFPSAWVSTSMFKTKKIG